ncbi:MAG: iron ABC transporter permease [Burkholderiaceae bacterium]|nr:iron ABC transporter permease [Burkholderiaceae bacterium]
MLVAAFALFAVQGRALARAGAFRSDTFTAVAVMLVCALLLVFVGIPVARTLGLMFFAEDGSPALAPLVQTLTQTRLWSLGCIVGSSSCGVFWNTLLLAAMTGASTTALGLALALLGERGGFRTRNPLWLRALALVPIITPPFVIGLGLILLFGRAGLVNQFLEWGFGVVPGRWLYGLHGVWLAQTFAFTPIAYLIVRAVVQGIAPSMEEAAQTLGSDRTRTFRTVTLPLLLPGVGNAFLVGFIESIADFGNPIVLGGGYAVFSTEIFFSIVGAQFDPGRAGALAALLLAMALAAFFAQRALLGSRRFITVSGKGDAGAPIPLSRRLRLATRSVAIPWLAFTAVVYAFAIYGGFAEIWGRDFSPTMRHYVRAFGVEFGSGASGLLFSGAAWQSLFTTLKLALIAAPITAAIGLLTSWLLARSSFRGQAAFEFGNLLTFAIPGTVLGVSYILAFNVPPLELTGTALIIVLSFIFRSLPVGVRAGVASFKQLDPSLDEASAVLGASTLTTLRRVTLPLLRPAIVTSLAYSFVRAVTTVSAVIFLVTAHNELATTFIIGRVQNGDYGVALAYCTVLIVLLLGAVLLIQRVVGDVEIGRRDTNGHHAGVRAPRPAPIARARPASSGVRR